jgi:hypothetical protein
MPPKKKSSLDLALKRMDDAGKKALAIVDNVYRLESAIDDVLGEVRESVRDVQAALQNLGVQQTPA